MHDHSTTDIEAGVVEGYDLFPPGKYPVTFENHDFINPPGLGHRIRLWFVITSGKHEGCLVPYFCKIRKTSRTGGFSCRRGSKYSTTMKALTYRQGQRPDRFPPSLLKGMKLLADVVTVDKRKDKTLYPKEDWYSKVESLEHES